MATGKGIKSSYGTANMLQRVMSDPLHQQNIQKAMTVGQDKRAVGGIEKMLGQGIAQEQTRMLSSEQIGRQISRRKDKLDFAKKMADQRNKRWKKEHSYSKKQMGMELGLGLASTAVTAYGNYKNKQRRAERRAFEKKQLDYLRRIAFGNKQSYSVDDPYNTEEPDPYVNDPGLRN